MNARAGNGRATALMDRCDCPQESRCSWWRGSPPALAGQRNPLLPTSSTGPPQAHGKGFSMIPNSRIPHRESFEKMAATFYNMSCSFRTRSFSQRRGRRSASSDLTCPLHGNEASLSCSQSFFHRPRIVSRIPKSRATWEILCSPSVSRRTASS